MERVAKQVIVVRTDLGMPAGKLAAQAAHMGQQWLIDVAESRALPTPAQREWMRDGLQTIIAKRVSSEAKLLALYDKAKEAGLAVHLVTDVGLTVFEGVPTRTGLSIGPHFVEDMEAVVKRLQNL